MYKMLQFVINKCKTHRTRGFYFAISHLSHHGTLKKSFISDRIVSYVYDDTIFFTPPYVKQTH